jgi:hypothetical protein
MFHKKWARLLLCVALAILSIPAFGAEKIDWLKSKNPALVLKSGRTPITGFKPIGEIQTPAGKALAYSAELKGGAGKISVRAAELLDFPALVLWLKFDQGLADSAMGNSNLVCAGLELDQPKNLPRVLSFGMSSFAPPHEQIVPSAGPLVFYNDKFETVMVSPLDHFLVSMINGSGNRLSVGLEGELKSVPAGLEQPIVFYFGKGIRKSFDGWGELLRKWHNKERPGPYADVGISRLGYWTDNGSYYYYKTEGKLNYQDTLLAVKKEADKLGIPFGYFQLDSWWYPKTTDKKTGIGPIDWLSHFLFGGAKKWEARPELFPEGLPAFSKKLGLPIEAHARWFDQKNDYRSEYKFVNGQGMRRPAFPVEDRFWDMIMSNAKKWGIAVYEQDWLDAQWRMIAYLRESVDAGEKWLDAMSKSAAKQDLTIQYCMANPGMFMQAVKYPNVTQARCSNDYLAGAPKSIYWIPFTKVSMLAWASGLYPWKDVFESSSGQRRLRNERVPEEEALMSILSAGMVGPGDKIGSMNKELLMRTCRKDGLLLKPDRPAMPIDKMFVENKTLYTTITETRTAAGTYYYVAAYNIFPDRFKQRELTFSELGIEPGNYLVYSWNDKKIQDQKDKVVFPAKLDRYRSAYYVIAPAQAKAPVLIGETEKFVSVSNARFVKIDPAAGRLALSISGVVGEEITLAFKSAQSSEAKIISGADLVETKFDQGRGLFTLRLKMKADRAELQITG